MEPEAGDKGRLGTGIAPAKDFCVDLRLPESAVAKRVGKAGRPLVLIRLRLSKRRGGTIVGPASPPD